VPSGDDKLVQEVVRILLAQIYESVFSERSHGFRKARSCHTALEQVQTLWKGTKWFVEMDIQGFYDNINHDKMIDVLEKKIDDQKFIFLIKAFLKSGYLEDWKFHNTYSGAPQGGICSPILANIYLHELDTLVEKMINRYYRGEKRRPNNEYNRIRKRKGKLVQKLSEAQSTGGMFPLFVEELKSNIVKAEKEQRKEPYGEPLDENFRRLQYVRYADDFVFGIIGPKSDAEFLMIEIKEFLNKELLLSIAEEKSGIKHANEGVIFLGYQVIIPTGRTRLCRHKCGVTKDGRNFFGTARSLNSQVDLRIPVAKVWDFCKRKKYFNSQFTPVRRDNLLHLSDYEIVSTINSEMRGFANYYALAHRRPLKIMENFGLQSLFKTLGNNHKCSGVSIRNRMKSEDEHYLNHTHKGKVKRLKVFKLKHVLSRPNVRDQEPHPYKSSGMVELSARLNANQCDYCGKKGGYFEVHHIKKVSEIRRKRQKKLWEILHQSRNRKTLVLCVECHQQLHKGELPSWKRNLHT
jgi:group II intron reverse transcriptase/maturase